MERFERVMKALIVEEDIDYNDIIKVIETITDESTQEKIIEELCSYADLGLMCDTVF